MPKSATFTLHTLLTFTKSLERSYILVAICSFNHCLPFSVLCFVGQMDCTFNHRNHFKFRGGVSCVIIYSFGDDHTRVMSRSLNNPINNPALYIFHAYRVVSLATQAIVNSVRKTLAAVQVNNQPQSPQASASPRGQGSPKGPPKVQRTPRVTIKQEVIDMEISDELGPLQSRHTVRKNKQVCVGTIKNKSKYLTYWL